MGINATNITQKRKYKAQHYPSSNEGDAYCKPNVIIVTINEGQG